MHSSEILLAAFLEEDYLSLEQLSSLCKVEQEWILSHIDDGLLTGLCGESGIWRFPLSELTRTRRIVSIERNFDAVPELAALVADLQEELEKLRAQLARSPG